MKTTERFHLQRVKDLQEIFSETNLVEVWRNVVRQQLRSQDISDLHDYYDFNVNIKERSAFIQQQILSGQYRAKSPLIYKLEKKYGVCRHIMLPCPSDALVLQTIVEKSLQEKLLNSQPNKQAYYSRDKHTLKLPHEFKDLRDYPWHIQWKKFQKEIWKFGSNCNFLAVTDITNYYDSIGLRELRHIISSQIETPEVVLDLLFTIIEQLSWNPDYLPSSLKGLPTINLEAARLLAHALLFEVDEVIQSRTNGNFVRWMDDINFGVNSFEEACETLGVINDVLKSRGLALNLGKTNIYNPEEVERHFLVKENKFLDSINTKETDANKYNEIIAQLYQEFNQHKKQSELKSWDKVTKRFFTTVGKLKSNILLGDIRELFLKHPSIRSNIIYYLSLLGFSEKTSKVVIEILENLKVYDDVTLFSIVKLLTDWSIPNNQHCKDVLDRIYSILKKNKKPFDYYCTLWFMAKYSKPQETLSLIQSNKSLWIHDPFLRRQIISVIPRIVFYKHDLCQKMLDEETSSGLEDSGSVANNIRYLGKQEKLSFDLNAYLFPKNKQTPYPLAKYLILLACLSSEHLKSDESVKKKVFEYVNDPWYLHWLEIYVY